MYLPKIGVVFINEKKIDIFFEFLLMNLIPENKSYDMIYLSLLYISIWNCSE
ncbi:GSCOCG00004599001-RA-CDS, partial [Cotesia congregata]